MFSKRNNKLIKSSIDDKYLKLKLRKNKIFRSTKLTNYIFDQFGRPKSYSCYVEIRKVIESEIISDGETDQETEDADFQTLVENVVLKINHLKDQVKPCEKDKTSTGSWHAGFGDRVPNRSAVESDSESSVVDIEGNDKGSSKNKRKVKTKKTPAKTVTTQRQTRQSAKKLSSQNDLKTQKRKNTRKTTSENDFSPNENSDNETEEDVPVRRRRSISVGAKSVMKNVKETTSQSTKKNAPTNSETRYSPEIPPTPPTSQIDPEPEVPPEANLKAKQTTLDKFFSSKNKSTNVNSNLLQTPGRVSPKTEPKSAQKTPSSVVRKGLINLTPSKCTNLISPLKIDTLKKNLLHEIDEMSTSQLSEMLNSQIFEEIANDATLDMFSSLQDCTQPIAQSTAINNTDLIVASQIFESDHTFEMKNVVNSTPINSATKKKQVEKTELPVIAEDTMENESSHDDSFSQVPPTQESTAKPRNLPKVIQSTLVNTKYIIREQGRNTEEPIVPKDKSEEPSEKVPGEENQSGEREDRSSDGDLEKGEEEKMDIEEGPSGEVHCDDDSVTSFESAKEIIEPVQVSRDDNINGYGEGNKTENQDSNDTASKYETNKSESDYESNHSNKSVTSDIATGFAELSQYPRWKRQSDIYTDSEDETKKSDKSGGAEGDPLDSGDKTKKSDNSGGAEGDPLDSGDETKKSDKSGRPEGDPLDSEDETKKSDKSGRAEGNSLAGNSASQLQISEGNESDSSSGRHSPGPLPNGSLPMNDEDMDDDKVDDKETSEKINNVSRLNLMLESESSGDEETSGLNFRSEISNKDSGEGDETEIKAEETFEDVDIDIKDDPEDLNKQKHSQDKSDDIGSHDTEVESKKKKLQVNKSTEVSKEGEKILKDKEELNCLQTKSQDSENQGTEVEGKKKKKLEVKGSAEEIKEKEEKFEEPKSSLQKKPEDSGQETETETKKKKKKKKIEETKLADKKEKNIEGSKSPLQKKPEDSDQDTETETKKKKKKKRLEEIKSPDKKEDKRPRSLSDKSEGFESQDTEVEGERKKKKKKVAENGKADDKPESQSTDINTSDDETRSGLQSQAIISQTADEDLAETTEKIKRIRRLDLLAKSDSSDGEETSGFYVRTKNNSKNSDMNVSKVSENEEEEKKKSKESRKKARKTSEDSPVKKVEAEKKKKKIEKDKNESEVSPENSETEKEETPTADEEVHRKSNNEEDDESINQQTINRLNSICRLNFTCASDSDSGNEQTFSADTAYRVKKIKDDEEETDSLVKAKEDDKLLSKSEVKLEIMKEIPTGKKVQEKRRTIEKKKRVSERSKRKDDEVNDPDWSMTSEVTEDEDLDVSKKKRIDLVIPREKDNLRALRQGVKSINRSMISNGTLSLSKTEKDFEDKPVTSLSELVEREKLVEETRDCTFSLEDLGTDDELFVFTMPTKILKQNLKGGRFNINRTSVTIGSEKYAVQQKTSKEVACITQVVDEKGNKKYKTVNIRPSGNIAVLHQMKMRSRKSSSKSSSRSSSVVNKVPGPKKTTKRKSNSNSESLIVKKKKLEINATSNDLSDFSE